MRILLFEHPREPSPAHFNDIANTPLWSCLLTGYAGAALQQAGFEVVLTDGCRWTFPAALDYLSSQDCDLLAVHAVYFWEPTEKLFQLLQDWRQQRPKTPVCLYGFFPTLAWQDILTHYPAVDYVVVGEPEDTLVALATNLQRGQAVLIPGLAARIQGEAAFGGWRPPITPPDRLPWPLRPHLAQEETVSILASRGCYNCCSFCLIPTLNGSRPAWRSRALDDVVAEIAALRQQGKTDFYFVDPNFIGPGKAGQEQARRLAARLADLEITFGMECRANDLTSELMHDLAAAGLTSLLLGIESGGSQVLQRLGKHTSISQNERAIAIVREAGLEPEIGFIMFEAYSTLADIAANLQFLEQNHLLDRLGRTANLLYHDHIAFKGTRGYQQALQEGRLRPQGLFGFEGQLVYADPRVGWLAGIIKPLCQFVLREMGSPSSSIYWRQEVETGAYRAVNDRLVEIFRRLLQQAAGRQEAPSPAFTEGLRAELEQELRQLLAQPLPPGDLAHDQKRSCC